MRAYLHIGAGKTGTSTIQASLARHRDAVHAAGLHYPVGERNVESRSSAGGISSGNGTPLARYLSPDRGIRPWSRHDVQQWLTDAVAAAEGRDILISSEMLQSIRQPQLEDLRELFAERGLDLHIIFYVRHLLDWKLSAFAQNAKVGALHRQPPEERTPDGYIAAGTSAWPRQLEMLASVLGRERVICRLYDADRARLVANFLDAIRPGLGAAITTEVADTSINRSPNLAEFALFASLNEHPGMRLVCRDLVDVLLNAPSVVDSPGLGVSQPAFDAFAERAAPLVRKVSEEFLPPETPLLLTSGRVTIGEVPPASAEQVAAVAAAAFTRLSERMRREAEAQREQRRAARTEMKAPSLRPAPRRDPGNGVAR